MTPIERIARALCGKCGCDPDQIYEAPMKPSWVAFMADARAALDAMREPTAEMMAAAARLGRDSKTDPTWGEIYTAMIDAALVEGAP